MQKLKIITVVFVTLFLTLTLIKTTTSEASSGMQTFFSRKYAGISIQVNATGETVPGANMTIGLLVNCTADGVYLDFLNLSVYGYEHFRYGLEKLSLPPECVMNNISLIYHDTTERNYNISIPDDVWDLTYTELHLKYSIEGAPYEYNEIFPITIVRNVLWEHLENQLLWLNNTIMQLNGTFWKSFQMDLTAENLAYINRTYWELQQNYTAVQRNLSELQARYNQLQQNYTTLQGNLGELNNTRSAVAVLAITSIFFLATTLYLIMRKPKEYY
jgi:hypothetical protein